MPFVFTCRSYCHWAGITCCLTAGSRVLRTCGSGFSSVGSIVLPGEQSKLVKQLLHALAVYDKFILSAFACHLLLKAQYTETCSAV